MNSSLGVLVKPVTEEFEWKRSVFSGATLIGTLLGGVAALFVGPSIDRFGAKWVLFLGFLVTGILFLLLSKVHGVVQFFLILIAGRLILQGIINVADAVVVPKWFITQRGRASAIAALGPRLGTGVLPFMSQSLTNAFGWRTAAVGIGLAAWAITLGPILFWLKRRPEDMGLTPDGGQRRAAAAKGKSIVEAKKPRETVEYTLKEVLRFRGFYVLLLGFFMSQFFSTGISFNLLPLLTDQGVSTTQAVTVVSLWSLTAIPSTLVGGFMAERLPHRLTLVGIFCGLTVGTYLLTLANSFALGLLFAVVHGSFFGMMLLYQSLTFADYYGRAHLGAIRGFVTVFFMIANAFGPFVATLFFDVTGSYLGILRAYVVLSLLVACFMYFARPPRKLAADHKGLPYGDP